MTKEEKQRIQKRALFNSYILGVDNNMWQILLGKSHSQKVLISVYCGQDNLEVAEIVVHLSEDFNGF